MRGISSLLAKRGFLVKMWGSAGHGLLMRSNHVRFARFFFLLLGENVLGVRTETTRFP
jgi:hypothetical protein